MSTLKISLLRQPRILLDDAPFQTHSLRTTALLAYLALLQKPCSRAELLDLLWDQPADDHHAGPLRTVLWRLRQTPLTDWLNISDAEIALRNPQQIQVDALDFQGLLHACAAPPHHPPSQICSLCLPQIKQAADLYRGDFMDGHYVTNASKFTNWQTDLRYELRQQALSAHQRLVDYYSQNGQPEQAIPYAKHLLEFDPSNENTHQLLMRLYDSSGRRLDALAQYRHCQRAIARNHNATPSVQTNLLYNQIRGAGGHPHAPLTRPILALVSLENVAQLWAQDYKTLHKNAERLLKIANRCTRHHGGQVIKYEKDHIIALFTKGHPLHFALDIYSQITEEPWGSTFTPQLRISVNAIQEEAAPSPGQIKIDAAPLQSLYAMAAAAWPGQVLISNKAAEVLVRPNQSQIRDHGTHLLKDMKHAVQVWELLHPELSENQGRPIRSLSQRPDNLPKPLTPFIGREQERETVSRTLRQPDCRLLTLAGPGGIGKTRLALQVAEDVKDEYTDGVTFAGLAATKHAHHIPTVLADPLGLRYNTKQDHWTQVISYLKSKQCLLVLDNLEHLLDGSEVLADLLVQAPGVKILATSRERLNLSPELVIDVAGLPCPDAHSQPDECKHLPAMQLFLQSARRFSPKPLEDDETIKSIAEICRLVNGIPLAIELAAAWVRTLRCHEIAARIKENLDFLGSSLRDLPERQRSLRAVFEHSWSLLSEEERRVLLRLCRFRGGFTTQAAEQVADATVLTLTSLADKSMLQVTREGRYDMLDVLRHYAAEKLQQLPGEPETTRQRHGNYYAAQLSRMIVDLNTHQQLQVLATFQAEYENIRLAWNWALQHARWEVLDQMQLVMYQYHDMVARFADGQAIFARAVQILQPKASPQQQGILAKLRMWWGWFAFRLGNQGEGLAVMEEALEIFQQNGLLWEQAYTLNYLAEAYIMLRRFDLAMERVAESQRVYPPSDPPTDPLQTIQNGYIDYLLGSIHYQKGFPNLAKPLLERSLQTLQSLGNHWATIRVLNTLAGVWESLENHSETLRIRLHIMNICEEMGDRRSMASTLNNLANTYEEMRAHDQATQALNQALAITREIGDRRLMSIILLNLASDHRSIYHTPEKAIPLAQEALKTFEEISDPGGMVYAAYDLAGAYLDAGQANRAYGTYCQALHHASEKAGWQLHVLHGFACYYAHTENLAQAIALCAMILVHPASEMDTRERAASLLSKIEDRLPPNEATAARQAGRSLSLDEARVQVLLTRTTDSLLDDEENFFGL